MAQTPLPKKGAFEATYPSKEWREVPAQRRRPIHTYLSGPRPFIVGGGNDV